MHFPPPLPNSGKVKIRLRYVVLWIVALLLIWGTFTLMQKTQAAVVQAPISNLIDQLIDDVPIPQDAKRMKSEYRGTDDTLLVAKNLSFRVREPYPSTQRIEPYLQWMRDRDWVSCRSMLPGKTDRTGNWRTYVSRKKRIHRYGEFWSDGKSKTIRVSIEYKSRSDNPGQPDNNRQIIEIMIRQYSPQSYPIALFLSGRVVCGNEDILLSDPNL